jgi:hypothetical protein
MKTSKKAGIAVIALIAAGIQGASANSEERSGYYELRSCPSGTAVQGVDFIKRQFVCIPVGGGSGALKVMDANNAQVGVFIGFGVLARLVNGEWMQLTFDRNGLNSGGLGFYYESNDCTGPAYLPDFSPDSIPRFAAFTVNGTSATIYSPVPGTHTEKTIQSTQNLFSAGFDACQLTDGSVQPVAVPQATTISNNAPFRIEQ